jgi:DNA helicase-2/ATP-dependent DNA helicase PcrA
MRCPVDFYYTNVLKAPLPPSPEEEFALNFGIAVHKALQLFVQQSRESDKKTIKRFLSANELVLLFEDCMKEIYYRFDENRYDDALKYGSEILRRYHETEIAGWTTVISIERDFKADYHGIKMKGRIDKLEFGGPQAMVIDYKTGNADKAAEKLRPPRNKALVEENPLDPGNGTDYWRQAMFYKVLVSSDIHKKYTFKGVQFDFVEPSKQTGQFEKGVPELSPEGEMMFNIQLQTAWKSIHNGDFSKSCGRQDCYWCNFAKNDVNQLI